MLQTLLEGVETVTLATETRDPLGSIQEATVQVRDLSTHTAIATEEKSQDSADINQNLTELSNLTHSVQSEITLSAPAQSSY